jgi:hypothetical protein
MQWGFHGGMEASEVKRSTLFGRKVFSETWGRILNVVMRRLKSSRAEMGGDGIV